MLAMSRVDCSRGGECNRQRGLLPIVYVTNYWPGRMDVSCDRFNAVIFSRIVWMCVQARVFWMRFV